MQIQPVQQHLLPNTILLDIFKVFLCCISNKKEGTTAAAVLVLLFISIFQNCSYHDGEQYRGGLDVLDDPQGDQAEELDTGEHVDSHQRHSPQVGQVRLVLFGHEEQEDPVKELEAVERGHAHEEEHPVQDRHGDLAQDRGHQH